MRSSMTGTSEGSVAWTSVPSGPISTALSRRPNPSDPPLATLVTHGIGRFGLRHRAEALHPGQDPSLAIVEPFLDVHGEEEAPARRPDAVGDRDGVVGLV